MVGAHKLILYDGVCLLCNYFVKFVINHDRRDIYRFRTIQSNKKDAELDKSLESVLLIDGNITYEKSTAVIRIVAMMSIWWRLVLILFIVPKFLRDYIYTIIASNRYKYFGKANSCMVPDESIRHKFV